MEIVETSDRIKTCSDERKVKLYNHQLSLIHRMEKLEKGSVVLNIDNENYDCEINMGVIGDKAMSGKTYSILELCRRNKKKKKKDNNGLIIINKDISIKNTTINTIGKDQDNKHMTLLVINNYMLHHWTKHIRDIGGLSHLSVKTIKKNKIIVKRDIIICISSVYNKFIKSNENIIWDRIIFDDADTLVSINEIPKYKFLWFISSNYDDLYFNNKANRSFIRNYFINIENKGFMKQLTLLKCSDEYINKSINYNYNIIINNIKCKRIRKFPFYSQFSCEIASIAILIECRQYETAFRMLNGEVYNSLEEYSNYLSNDISNHIRNRYDYFNIKNELCQICMDYISVPVITKCCQTIYCFNCMLDLVENGIDIIENDMKSKYLGLIEVEKDV